MQKQTSPVLVFLLVMWLVLVVDAIIPANLSAWGLQPRTLRGLIGIPLMPFLHGGFGHLIGNTVPLVILLWLTTASRHRAWVAITAIVAIGGVLLWIFGRSANHVGASALVFGLITYLITIGFREKRFKSLGIALMVGFLFGGTLITGVIPMIGSGVSWDGHLCGAVAGAMVGIASTQKSPGFF